MATFLGNVACHHTVVLRGNGIKQGIRDKKHLLLASRVSQYEKKTYKNRIKP